MKTVFATAAFIALSSFAMSCADRLALHKAAERGNVEKVKSLIAAGYDVDIPNPEEFGWTPLIYAVTSDNPNVVAAILAGGADVNARDDSGQTALFSAIFQSEERPAKIEMLHMLIEAGADIDARSDAQWTPLLDATGGGNHKAMRILIARGADVNAQNKYGRTPLMVAVMNNKPEAIRILLASGANRNLRDTYGNTACYFHDPRRTGGPCPLYRL